MELIGALLVLAQATTGDSNDLAMWTLLVGSLLPPLVAVLQQPRWPNWLRAAVGVASSVVAALVTTYLNGGFDDGSQVVTAILTTLVAAQATYMAFWKTTRIATKIEERTSPSDPPPPQHLTSSRVGRR